MALWDFCNIFLPNTGEDQTKALSKCGAPGTEPYVKSVPGLRLLHYDHKNVRLGPQLANFRIKTLNFGLYV